MIQIAQIHVDTKEVSVKSKLTGLWRWVIGGFESLHLVQEVFILPVRLQLLNLGG